MNPDFPHSSDSGNNSVNGAGESGTPGYGSPEANGHANANSNTNANGNTNGAGPITVLADVLVKTEPEAVIHLRAAARAGVPWPQALLEAVALWTAPQEVHQGRTYRYLIQGEALDWLTLAERLCAELDELATPAEVASPAHGEPAEPPAEVETSAEVASPAHGELVEPPAGVETSAHGELVEPPQSVPTAAELEGLLFQGQLPETVTPEEFRERMGGNKYRAYLNYWYGVVVEEALQQAVEDEVRKRHRARCYPDNEDLVEEAFTHLYGATRANLLKEYRQEARIPQRAALSLADYKEFTYWLSKRRFNLWDPARVASDTRKGIRHLKQLEQIPGPLAEELAAAGG